MHYMLMFYEPREVMAERDDPVRGPVYMGAWMDYIGALREAGIMVSGNGLQLPHTGTTVRVADGRRHVQDGPFAETKEQLGGYVIIDVPALDEALAWAARAPSSASAATEVRPCMPPPPAR